MTASTSDVDDDPAVDSPDPDDRDVVRFEISVRVPMLDEVTSDRVADVVEDGWYETFELRVADVAGVLKADRDVSPSVRRSIDDAETRIAVVEATLRDRDTRRGVDDAVAIVNYVEGTYVQGIIPGYAYEEPVADLLSQAHATGGSDGVSNPSE
ncbi:hypothetical protein AArcSl_0151 [Halalkaliarchaeum desulfuricum]|uniref:Uncharacterized protein n=1 Tax=Halalkaliarchaeum desulfuricum TaxID=2055893 RepID=A0A343TFD5_9EURY|nr:hypothetical protein AArcSl_0151 [Halalkaliarchaeum desulfuricum]